LGTDRAPGSLIAADLNQDGRLDLALGNLVSSSVVVLFNATSPGASAPAQGLDRSMSARNRRVRVRTAHSRNKIACSSRSGSQEGYI